MTEFKLDTSGYVKVTHEDGQWHRYVWSDLSPFTQGYIEALFASAWAEPKFRSDWLLRDVVKGVPEDEWRTDRPAFSDLAPETLARIIADCAWRQEKSPRLGSVKDGADFWRARQGENGWPVSMPPLTVQLGDDGTVRFA